MIKTYRQLFAIFSPAERRRFGWLIVMALVNGVLQAAGLLAILPFLRIVADPAIIQETPLLQALFEGLGFDSERGFLIFAGAAAFAVLLLSSLFQAATMYRMTRFSTLSSYSLSWRLLQGYLMQPYVWTLGRNTADLGKAALSEVEVVLRESIMPAIEMMMVLSAILFVAGVLCVMEPMVALGALAIIGGAYLAIYWGVRRRLETLGAARVESNRARFKIAQEATGGMKEVKIQGLETSLLTQFRVPARRMAEVQAEGLLISLLPRYALETVAFGGLILLILMLLGRGTGGLEAVLPTLGLVALAGLKLFPTTQQLYRLVTMLRRGGPALEALLADLEETRAARSAASRDAGPGPEPLGLQQAITLRGVTFAYPDTQRSALHGLDLEIAAQSVVGLVGGTGAGKTTVVDVILGLLEPQEGQLLIDGQPVTAANRRAWQRSIGYVPQQIFLTDDSVAANIAFGLPPEQIDHAAVQAAARIAALHDFITEELPKGYETLVGERGVRLSGGQRQRIGIARALYHNPDVLILDEATSALDTITEEAVMEAVHNLGGAKTIIMIAHRLSTVEDCDCIHLLDQGRVAASGTYAELVAGNASFRRMARE
jgi:ABC-type multidrug transport system fused ATPase/permease subunit